jgi:hypothetical protein
LARIHPGTRDMEYLFSNILKTARTPGLSVRELLLRLTGGRIE